MNENIIKKFNNLKDNDKIYFIHILFDFWCNGNIYNDYTIFLPQDVGIKNVSDISNVYKYFSNIDESKKANELIDEFKYLNFYEKLSFMMYVFQNINNNKHLQDRIFTNITDNMDFNDLSDEILKYKVFL